MDVIWKSRNLCIFTPTQVSVKLRSQKTFQHLQNVGRVEKNTDICYSLRKLFLLRSSYGICSPYLSDCSCCDCPLYPSRYIDLESRGMGLCFSHLFMFCSVKWRSCSVIGPRYSAVLQHCFLLPKPGSWRNNQRKHLRLFFLKKRLRTSRP